MRRTESEKLKKGNNVILRRREGDWKKLRRRGKP
jgi:hypothetical protein